MLTPGPVFARECVAAARHWQTFALRAGFVALLLVALAVAYLAFLADPRQLARGDADYARLMAALGERFFLAFAGTQLALVILAAPAVAAGAFGLDKARGTLAHMLVTDLSAREIVADTFAARLLSVWALLLASLPVPALATLLGGVPPEAVAGAYLVAAGTSAFATGLALFLSVWGRRPHEVVLVNYVAWAVLLLAVPAWEGVAFRSAWAFGQAGWDTHPFGLTFAPFADSRGWHLGKPAAYFAVTFGLGVALAAAAGWLLRGAVTAADRPRRAWRWLGKLPRLPLLGPSLDRNPVAWREWHYRRPGWAGRVAWGVFALGATGFSVLAMLTSGRAFLVFGPLVNASQVSIGLLLLTATAAAATAEERQRGGLDILLVTPLTAHQVVFGKWWGAFRPALLICVLPVVVILKCGGMPDLCTVIAILVGTYLVAASALCVAWGVLVAIVQPRVGLAFGQAVTGYLTVAVGAELLVFALQLTPVEDFGELVGMASPFMFLEFMTVEAAWDGSRWHVDRLLVTAFGLALAAAVLAIVFLQLAVAALGRRPTRVVRPPA